MKHPLYCKNCDMLTGHETEGMMKARCRVCGAERNSPFMKYLALGAGIVIVIGGAVLFIL